jgi:zinc and cadmium transporter
VTAFLPTILAGILISALAFSGVVVLFMNQQRVANLLIYLVSLSAGALLGGAFLHLLPEALEGREISSVLMLTLGAIIFFFLIEKVLHWRHCHKADCNVHTFGYMNLVGDSFHNFLDGIIIFNAFMLDFNLGLVTTLAVALHEIPQEIGDFGVLLYSGFTPRKALIFNFLVALMVIVGGIFGYVLSSYNQHIASYILPITAGGFIYIAASDLLPEIKRQTILKKSLISFLVFLFGIGLMFIMKLIAE